MSGSQNIQQKLTREASFSQHMFTEEGEEW